MSDEPKHTDELHQPLARTSPDDTTVVMDDYVGPQDLVGGELADRLQRALQDASEGLGAERDAQGSPFEDDDGIFESPDEVLEASESARAEDEVVASAEDVTAALEEMNALIQSAVSAPVKGDATSGPDAPMPAGDAIAPADEEILTVEQILGMSEGSSKPLRQAGPVDDVAAMDDVATEATLGQLDEFLAGRADHAVADAFETVHDVLAVEQGGDGPITAAPRAAFAPADVASAPIIDAEPPPAMVDGEAPVAPAAAAFDPASSAAVAAASEPLTAPVVARTAAPGDADVALSRHAKFVRFLRMTAAVCGQGLYGSCRALNRPLRHANDSTRRVIGYVGLVTTANAALLLLGKLIFG